MPVPRNQYRNYCQHRLFADKSNPAYSGYYRHRTRRISQDACMDLDYYETDCENPFLPSYLNFVNKDLGWDGVVEAERFLGFAELRSLGS